MTDEADEVRLSGGRGPAYPYIALDKAIERIETIRAANMARVAVAPLAYYKAWGFAGENGNARQTLAALNHFNLVEYVGRGKERLVKLSPLALRIVFDSVPGSQQRAGAIREAALGPAIYQKVWQQYGRELPPDYAIETFLMRDCGFNDVGAAKTISGYRDTFEFAGLAAPDNMPPEETPADDPEGGGKVDKPSSPPPPPADRPKRREVKLGMKEDVFSLAEGDVTFQWPEAISEESYQDLEDWTKLLLRKIKRAAQTEKYAAGGREISRRLGGEGDDGPTDLSGY